MGADSPSGVVASGAVAITSNPRAVRVVTEVAAVEKAFDYAVTEATEMVGIGDRVRINFHNRSVRGWVVDEGDFTPELKPLAKWQGFGPPSTMLPLLHWASRRWSAPLARFLLAASPTKQYKSLPASRIDSTPSLEIEEHALIVEPGLHLIGPCTDPLALILGAHWQTWNSDGSLLVLVPTEAWAMRLRGRLEQRGLNVACGDGEWDRMRAGWPVIVGARGTVFAPAPKIRGAVIVDCDDEAFRSESSPTWDALSVLEKRCELDGAPLWATSLVPVASTLGMNGQSRPKSTPATWPEVVVADRRNGDPHEGVLSALALEAAHRALEGTEPVALCVVLQRLGAGRLLACRNCGELARCSVCGGAEVEVDGKLSCGERHEERENFCRNCGATNLRAVRSGVTTLARDVAAQLRQEVSEVTAATDAAASLKRVVVGTEAIWQRVRRASLVIFVDFDQYLLAPRENSRIAALTAIAKAGRLVGSRVDGRGSVLVQTRRGEDLVLSAANRGELAEIMDDEVETAELLGLPPYGWRCEVSGENSKKYIDSLGVEEVRIRETNTGFIVTASDLDTLSSALSTAKHPGGRLRIARN